MVATRGATVLINRTHSQDPSYRAVTNVELMCYSCVANVLLTCRPGIEGEGGREGGRERGRERERKIIRFVCVCVCVCVYYMDEPGGAHGVELGAVHCRYGFRFFFYIWMNLVEHMV